jgi:hypothetical protein
VCASFLSGVFRSKYLATAVFLKDSDKLFDSFSSVERAAPGILLSDNIPHIGHWTRQVWD